MLRLYLKIWEWEWIFGSAVKAISSPGSVVRAKKTIGRNDKLNSVCIVSELISISLFTVINTFAYVIS